MPRRAPTEMQRAIRSSVDMQYYKRQLLANGIAAAALALFVGISIAIIDLGQGAAAFGGILLLYSPVLLYYIIRICELMRDSEGYVLCEAVLDMPQSGLLRGSMYFSATFKDGNGYNISRDTRAVFSLSVMSRRYFGDFTRTRALIAYNEDLDELIVIKTME